MELDRAVWTVSNGRPNGSAEHARLDARPPHEREVRTGLADVVEGRHGPLVQHHGPGTVIVLSLIHIYGPLDPERKRMFMAMKRRVLELGRYAREFFVSQTPELTAMADAVIDLEDFAAEAGPGWLSPVIA